MRDLTLNVPLLTAFSRLYYNIKTRSYLLGRSVLLLAMLASRKTIDIVIADDDMEDVELFMEAMSEIAPQANVTVARNGQHLSKLLAERGERLPDIIFLDLNMPLKNGHECLEEIRGDKKFKSTPVIIYSTSNNREDINVTFNHGANFYVPKPDSFADLKLIVKKLFELDWDMHATPQKEKYVLSAAQLGKV